MSYEFNKGEVPDGGFTITYDEEADELKVPTYSLRPRVQPLATSESH